MTEEHSPSHQYSRTLLFVGLAAFVASVIVACSAPPDGWVGAGRSQTLPAVQMDSGAAASDDPDTGVDAGIDTGASTSTASSSQATTSSTAATSSTSTKSTSSATSSGSSSKSAGDAGDGGT